LTSLLVVKIKWAFVKSLIWGGEILGVNLLGRHLSHTPNLFCFGFLRQCLALCLGQPGSQSPYSHIPCSWKLQAHTTMSRFHWLRWDLANFSQGWPPTMVFLLSTS
jgi:hypothetical protein